MSDISDTEQFYHLFPDPDLAKDLMNILDDFRIDARLKREYPALGHHMNRVNTFLAAKRPALGQLSTDTQRIVELIGQRLSSGTTNEAVPHALQKAFDFAVSVSKALELPDADIHQVARLTAKIYFFIDGAFDDPYQPIAPFSISLEPSTYRQYVENSKNATKSGKKQQGLSKESNASEKPPDAGKSKTRSPIEAPSQSSDTPHHPHSQNNQDLSQISEIKAKYPDEKDKSDHRGNKSTRPIISEKGLRPQDTPLFIDDVQSEKPDDLINFLPFHLAGQSELETGPGTFLYPEWGDDISGYRPNWSRVREHPLSAGSDGFYRRTLQKYAGLIRKIKREFQMMRPEGLTKLKRQFDGDDIDLDAAVDYFIDRKLGKSPSEKNYTRTRKNARDIAVSFLIDMSGSTRGKTIELEKEALVMMSEALCELGDPFSIYGFSGYTRQNVAFYIIKEFSEAYDHKIAGRISAIRDKHSTRIGPALRHAASKLVNREEKIKLLILLSDGRPEDREYDDAYGIEDTRAALKEGQKQGIRPFCITVDKKAPEYLHRMYSHSNWVVIHDTTKLPMKITRIYKQLTT